MSLFRDMDLYKAIILLSVLLLPASVGYLYWVDGRLEVARAARSNALKSKGELERIGEICQNLSTVKSNAGRSDDSVSSALFFERTILATSSDGGIGANNLQIGNERELNVSKEKATDIQVRVSIKDGNKDKPLPRNFVSAILYNLEESGSQVWKLRELDMVNIEADKFRPRAREAPPKTVEDVWKLPNMTFARRVPQQGR